VLGGVEPLEGDRAVDHHGRSGTDAQRPTHRRRRGRGRPIRARRRASGG
jgi:hypothetical protein